MQRQKRWKLTQLGFTLLETLIIVVVLGVLTTIAAPSLMSLMDGVKINQTITEVRGTLQEGQRQAIRNNKPCIVSLSFSPSGDGSQDDDDDNSGSDKNNGSNQGNKNGIDNNSGNGHTNPSSPALPPTPPSTPLPITTTQCPTTTEPEVPSGVDVASNISPAATTRDDVAVTFGIYGSAEFGVVGQMPGTTTGVRDPSGKIVAYIPTRQNVQKKCIAISNTLGLTRVGNYTGGVTPEEITQGGVCTALDWTTQ
jgi:type II secretory pathway pseudopilin PulG